MTRGELQGLIERYSALMDDPAALLEEGRKLASRPGMSDDPELMIYIGLLIGQVATLQDRLEALLVTHN